MQRGRGRWRSGADTCVFSPPVKCADEATRRDPNQYVSRIVSRNSSDVQIEEILRKRFPKFVEYGLASISEKACVPEYDAIDRLQNPDYQASGNGCELLGVYQQGIVQRAEQDHANLITKKIGEKAGKFIQEMRLDVQQTLSGLAHSLVASILLVPDNGPWIANQDLHLGNILLVQPVKSEIQEYALSNGKKLKEYIDLGTTYSAISDWGRVIYIENPTDSNSVRSAVLNWGDSVFGGNTNNIRNAYKQGNYTFPQHPPKLMSLLAHGYEQAKRGIASASALKAVRGSMAYVILFQSLLQTYTEPQLSESKTLTAVLESTSQADLIDKINAVVIRELGHPLIVESNETQLQVYNPRHPVDVVMTGGSISSSRRLPSVPKRKGLRSSSSSKKRYTRRRRALRSGKGGYRATRTGRKV